MHLENNMDVFCLDKKDKISLYSFIPRKKGAVKKCSIISSQPHFYAFYHGCISVKS